MKKISPSSGTTTLNLDEQTQYNPDPSENLTYDLDGNLYDLDGNLLTDCRWTCTWECKNRSYSFKIPPNGQFTPAPSPSNV